jgi:hypothetical protein
MERQFSMLEEVEDQIAMDPSGFVLDRVAPDARVDVAMQLLFDPGVLEEMQDRIVKAGVEGGIAALLESPEALRVTRAELKAARLETRETLRGAATERKAARESARRVATQIEQMIPEQIVGERREQLYQAALQDVSERCRRLRIVNLEPEDVALLVGDRFRREGITPAPAGGKKEAAPGGAPAPKGRTGEQFTQASAARKTAAAVAPAGAGAPAARPRPTLPSSTDGHETEARLKFIREHGGLAAALGKR